MNTSPPTVINRMALRKAKTIDLQGFSIIGVKKDGVIG
jgi:hypothetical protein